MKIKIAHLTSAHPVYDIRIFHKQCKSLNKAGYHVTLIARAKVSKSIDGVNIVAIEEHENRYKRFFVSTRDVYKQAIKSKAEIFHFHDPELIPIGVLLKLRGKKVIYDVHEDLPRQILNKYWINPLLRYPISWVAASVEWFTSRFIFSNIVTVTPKIASRFPKNKTIQVRNYPQLKSAPKITNNTLNDSKKQVAYIGSIDKTRGIIENIKAMGLVQDPSVHMVLAGPFSSKQLEEECRSLKDWERVEYHSWLNRDKVMQELSNSLAGLVVLHPTPSYIDSFPIKMFEYMLAGIPVIASNFPLWREIINDCGLLVDPMKPEEIAEAINWIIANPDKAKLMGANGQKTVYEKYNWQTEEKKLIELYASIAQSIRES